MHMHKSLHGIDDVFSATMCLLTGVMPDVTVQENGEAKDKGWHKAKKELMSNVKEFEKSLLKLRAKIDDGSINSINFKKVCPFLTFELFNV